MNFLLQHWNWGVEIAILTVCLYYTWKLFRGTRGAKVLTGLAILMIGLILVSQVLKLKVITELLRSFYGIFFIALIVIFQPELRRILAELGSQHLLSPNRQQTETIEAVINAIEELRKEKLGALIAFEQEVAYLPGRETGTEMDARVSDDLLETIFFPRTPLHDGGVLISGSRIVAAAAIFPLTQQEGLQRTLGLRHRAALGLSEETDAVVVTLSEETGIISLAYQGKLERPLTEDELRSRLTDILVSKSGTSAVRNLFKKAACL